MKIGDAARAALPRSEHGEQLARERRRWQCVRAGAGMSNADHPVQLIAKARAGFISIQKMGIVERATKGSPVAEAAISDALAAVDILARMVATMAGQLMVDFTDLRHRLDVLERTQKKPLALAIDNALKQ